MRYVCTLTADGHEPFVHRCSIEGASATKTDAAEFAARVWLLGHPERRYAKNISVQVEEVEE